MAKTVTAHEGCSKYTPQIVDERAENTPERTYAVFPKSSHTTKEGYQGVCYRQLARAINRAAWWLDEILVASHTRKVETFTYYGPNDLRWAFLLLGSQKAGHQQLMLNPNNHLEADLRLLDETHCHTIITTSKYQSRYSEILSSRPNLEVVLIADLDVWLDEAATVEPYAFVAPTDDGTHTPWLVSHSSGTTGQPKALPYTAGYQLVSNRQRLISEAGKLELPVLLAILNKHRFLLPFPQTWAAGTHFISELAIIWEMVPVLLPSEAPQPVTVDMIHDSLLDGEFDVALMLPFHLQEVAKRPDILQTIKSKNLDFIGYAGAVLDKEVAEYVIQQTATRIQPFYGDTSVGVIAAFATGALNDADFLYVGLSPQSGFVMEPVEEDPELQELVLHRSKDPHNLLYIFAQNPDMHIYRTRDLFRPHPINPYLWRPVGRRDDLEKNANLTKTNVGQLEAKVEKLPGVQGAVMGGQGEQEMFLIVELSSDNHHVNGSRNTVLDTVWATVEDLNNGLSEEVRVKKNRIIVATPDLPFRRLGKGTINRRAVLAEYADEIKALQA